MNPLVAASLDGLGEDALVALMEFMTAACLNPWEIGLLPGETRTRNMPKVPFGPNREGIVTYLIDDENRELLVTQVLWAG